MPILPFEFEASLGDVTLPLAVATSGGADSLCLLLLAHKWALQKGGRVMALTIDHGLRPESKSEALRVRDWAEAKGIEHVILEWTGQKPTACLQEKARQARYELLMNWCKKNQVSTLLLGHHQQDQEETFWMRLSAGSGLEGLSGMKKCIVREGITLLRPLLEFPKERLRATLRAENQAWIEDPSNQSQVFFRGRLRSFLEEEGLSHQRLNTIMKKLRVDSEFIHDALYKAIETHVYLCEGGYITLERKAVEDLHPALSHRLLSYLMQWFSGDYYPPRGTQVTMIMEKLKASSAFTAGGIYWIPRDKDILLSREISKIQKEIFLASIEEDTLWDQRYWIKGAIKNYIPEDTCLAPLELNSTLKKEIHTLIPRSVWPTLPALWSKGKIVSIPHFCYNELSETDYRKFFYLKPLFTIY